MLGSVLRIGIIGCGDVLPRHYLPGIESRADRVGIAALADPRPGAAEAIASAIEAWSPGARTYRDADEMLRSESLDGVFNLTPAPLHGPVNRAILEAGVACFSEKPLAASLAAARRPRRPGRPERHALPLRPRIGGRDARPLAEGSR